MHLFHPFSSLAFLSQFVGAHVPFPFLVLYGMLLAFCSIIPPIVGGIGVAWIVASQVISLVRGIRENLMGPAYLIRSCVASFIGLYVAAILILIPFNVRSLLAAQHHLAQIASVAGPSSMPGSLTSYGWQSFRDRFLSHGVSPQDGPEAGRMHADANIGAIGPSKTFDFHQDKASLPDKSAQDVPAITATPDAPQHADRQARSEPAGTPQTEDSVPTSRPHPEPNHDATKSETVPNHAAPASASGTGFQDRLRHLMGRGD